MTLFRRLRYWLIGLRATVRMLETRDEKIAEMLRVLERSNATNKALLAECERLEAKCKLLAEWYAREKALRQQYKRELDMNEATKAGYRAQLRQAEEARKDLAAFADKLSIPNALGPDSFTEQEG